MPAPDPYTTNMCIGRSGTARLLCNWTAQENDDLSSFIWLDPTRDLAHAYDNESITVKRIRWRKATSAEVVVRFDSVGDAGEILTLPEGESEGEESFASTVNGSLPDPDRDAPSNVVVSTDGALSTDRLDLLMDYTVHGTRKP